MRAVSPRAGLGRARSRTRRIGSATACAASRLRMPPPMSWRASSTHPSRSGAGRTRSPPITTTTSPLSSTAPRREARDRLVLDDLLVHLREARERPRSPGRRSRRARRAAASAPAGAPRTARSSGARAGAISSRRRRSPASWAGTPRTRTGPSGRTGDDQGGDRGRGTRHHPHVDAGLRACVHESESGVGDRRHARVGHERQVRPSSRWRRSSRTRRSSFPSKNEISGTLILRPDSSRPVRRVSSHATRSTAPSTSRARSERSPRLPIGVATSHRVPAVPAMAPRVTRWAPSAHGRKPHRRGGDGGRTQGLSAHPAQRGARHPAGTLTRCLRRSSA